jgi:hypothetical protein
MDTLMTMTNTDTRSVMMPCTTRQSAHVCEPCPALRFWYACNVMFDVVTISFPRLSWVYLLRVPWP